MANAQALGNFKIQSNYPMSYVFWPLMLRTCIHCTTSYTTCEQLFNSDFQFRKNMYLFLANNFFHTN